MTDGVGFYILANSMYGLRRGASALSICVIIQGTAGVPLGTLGGLSTLSWSIAGRDASDFDGESEPLQGSTRARADIRSADRFWL